MIVSASRRTDIPAFYGEWLLQRLRQGHVLVRHPFRPDRITRLSLAPETLTGLVFWTKNPVPLLGRLGEIEQLGHRFVFQYTLTTYGTELEPKVPAVAERVAAFRTLAERIGAERVLWRYDPILFTPDFSPAEHLRRFAILARALRGHTRICTISRLTLYAKCRRNLQGIDLEKPAEEEMVAFASELAAIAGEHGLALRACCDGLLTDRCGIEAARCIDASLLAALSGRPVAVRRDGSQRPGCGCAVSIDIGAYNTCAHGCRYCYANSSALAVAGRITKHDPASPLLVGWPRGDETIVVKQGHPAPGAQLPLFGG